MSTRDITAEWEVFVRNGAPGVGAVRAVHPGGLTIYLEGFGEVEITADTVVSAAEGKVLIDPDRLSPEAQVAVAHAHDREPSSEPAAVSLKQPPQD